ncbi:MAG: bile acid:sodium symporter family protein [Bacteroidota bacterium]
MFIRQFAYSFMILLVVALAMLFPEAFVQWGNFKTSSLIVPLLQVIMFGMGTAMSLDDFKGVIRMPKGVLVGLLCQFSIMPFIGFGLATLFGFEPAIAAGMILVGAAPSGLASNVMSYLAKAHLALSITLTAVATLLAPLVTPGYMSFLGGQFIEVDFWNMVWNTVQMVILPVIGGLMFHHIAYHPEPKGGRNVVLVNLGITVVLSLMIYGLGWEATALHEAWWLSLILSIVLALAWLLKTYASQVEKVMPFVSMAGIAFIIVVITANGRDKLLEVGLLLIIACLIHNLLGYMLGFSLARLFRMDTLSSRTISLEVGMQNSGLASGLAAQMNQLGTLGLAPAIFGPMMNITGSILAMWWRNRPVEKPPEAAE